MRLCSFDGCGKKHQGKGFCQGHRLQLNAGKELTPIYDTEEGRFWAKVDKKGPDECWLWTASIKDKWGYGAFMHMRAHQYSFMLHNGYVPTRESGKLIMHSCHNPICVNPAHLSEGTSKDNKADEMRSGRNPQSNKTHCLRGHEFTEENTKVRATKTGISRQCKECRRFRDRRRRARS